jgi:hypothetical protein
LAPEIIDPAFAKANPKRSFSIIENECFGLVVAKTGSINSGTLLFYSAFQWLGYESNEVLYENSFNKPAV